MTSRKTISTIHLVNNSYNSGQCFHLSPVGTWNGLSIPCVLSFIHPHSLQLCTSSCSKALLGLWHYDISITMGLLAVSAPLTQPSFYPVPEVLFLNTYLTISSYYLRSKNYFSTLRCNSNSLGLHSRLWGYYLIWI